MEMWNMKFTIPHAVGDKTWGGMRDCGGLQSLFPVTKLTPFFAWYFTHHIFYKLAGVDKTKHKIKYNGASHHCWSSEGAWRANRQKEFTTTMHCAVSTNSTTMPCAWCFLACALLLEGESGFHLKMFVLSLKTEIYKLGTHTIIVL